MKKTIGILLSCLLLTSCYPHRDATWRYNEDVYNSQAERRKEYEKAKEERRKEIEKAQEKRRKEIEKEQEERQKAAEERRKEAEKRRYGDSF